MKIFVEKWLKLIIYIKTKYIYIYKNKFGKKKFGVLLIDSTIIYSKYKIGVNQRHMIEEFGTKRERKSSAVSSSDLRVGNRNFGI